MNTLYLRGNYPIPVGRVIELTFFVRSVSHVFGKDTSEPDWSSPLIKDLETGIVYGTLTQFMDVPGVYNDAEVFRVPTEPLATRTVHTRFRARVLYCAVLERDFGRAYAGQTTLVVEPTAEGPAPYR